MRINQAVVANNIDFFKENFMNRWGFVEYTDPNKPCVFFGASESEDLIQKNNSVKVVLPVSPSDFLDFNTITNRKNLYLISPPSDSIPQEVIHKDLIVEIKDYSKFNPTPLGDKIYAYTGFKNGWFPNDISKLEEIQNHIDYEIITTSHNDKSDLYDINYLKENYYDKCFLNLNFSNNHGMTTVRELGLMGRMTIMSGEYYNYPCLIRCKDNDDIIRIINEEASKIGTLQNSINSHNIGEEWIDTEFWTQP